MLKGIIGVLLAISFFITILVPPGFLILVELGLLFIVTIVFWYWLFKIDALQKLFDEPAFQWATTSLLILFNVWFICNIILLSIGDVGLAEGYYMLSLPLFCLSASLYLNQKTIDKNKTLLVGTGIMACAATGGVYCATFSQSFVQSQFDAWGSLVAAGYVVFDFLGIF